MIYFKLEISKSFRSISSFSIWFAFSRHITLSLIWFSRILRESRDFFAARLFFLLRSQYCDWSVSILLASDWSILIT